MSPIHESIWKVPKGSAPFGTGRGNGAGKRESLVHLWQEDTQAGKDPTTCVKESLE